MRRQPFALVGAAVLLSAGVASAQVSLKDVQSRFTPDYAKCMASPAGMSTLGMVDCIGQETAVQDRRLNEAYRKALKDMTPDERKGLQAAQRAWIVFRDADCSARVDSLQWGAISRINGALCRLDDTVARTIELETFPPNDR